MESTTATTEDKAAEVVAVTTETKPAEVAAVSENKEAAPAEPAKTEAAPEQVQVEMVALSEKKAVEDKLAVKEAEITALSSSKSALDAELVASKAAQTAADEQVTKLTGELQATSSKVTELTNAVAASQALAGEYQKVLEAAIPQDMLSEAVLKAASSVVEGYDASKKVSEQTPATILKLLKFSETVKQASQSTNAGAVETVARKTKKPDPNLVFPGITIKTKKPQE